MYSPKIGNGKREMYLPKGVTPRDITGEVQIPAGILYFTDEKEILVPDNVISELRKKI